MAFNKPFNPSLENFSAPSAASISISETNQIEKGLYKVLPLIIFSLFVILSFAYFVLPAFQLLFFNVFYNNQVVVLKKSLKDYNSNDDIPLNDATPIKYENILGPYIISHIISTTISSIILGYIIKLVYNIMTP